MEEMNHGLLPPSQTLVGLEYFLQEYNLLCSRISWEGEKAKPALTVIEKLMRAQLTFAKALEDIVESKAAATLCDEGPEPQNSSKAKGSDHHEWGCFFQGLKTVSQNCKSEVDELKQGIHPKLAKLAGSDISQQQVRISKGRKLLTNLLSSQQRLVTQEEKLIKTCRDKDEEVALTAAAYIPVSSSHAKLMLGHLEQSNTVEKLNEENQPASSLDSPSSLAKESRKFNLQQLARAQSPSVKKVMAEKRKIIHSFAENFQAFEHHYNQVFVEELPPLLDEILSHETTRSVLIQSTLQLLAENFKSSFDLEGFSKLRSCFDQQREPNTCSFDFAFPPPCSLQAVLQMTHQPDTYQESNLRKFEFAGRAASLLCSDDDNVGLGDSAVL